MYYSFYMNERMLLDNWKYYQKKGECNWLLKRTLMNDETRTAKQKIAFYMENRRVVNTYSEFFKEQAEKVQEYIDDLDGRFENNVQLEYYLDHMYIHDNYEIMDYGRTQKNFNMYRRYNELKEHANDRVIRQLSFKPIPGVKLRDYNTITIYREDLKFIRNVRKHHRLTVSQIEILFGIIFFCRMYETENAHIGTEFQKKQFLGCFKSATRKDLDFVVDTVTGLEKLDDGDVVYDDWHKYSVDGTIKIDVTLSNNKLNLTKMSHAMIRDILDKRYCELCMHPFEPANNRQRVCPACKAKYNRLRARMRKVKERYRAKNPDACCGVCTDCVCTDCANWIEYWWDEFDWRCVKYKDRNNYPYPRGEHPIPEDELKQIMEQLKFDIKNVYTKEEKSKIIPWEMRYK